MPDRLTAFRTPIQHCVPEELGFLDSYQQTTWENTLWDDQVGGAIQGVPAARYFLRGYSEEMRECIGSDKDEPGYSRSGALLWGPRMDINHEPPVDEKFVTETAVARHLKEFGDISWYLANSMTLYDDSLSDLAIAGVDELRLDDSSNPTLPRGYFDDPDFEWEEWSLGPRLIKYLCATESVLDEMIEKRRSERFQAHQALRKVGGGLLVMMMATTLNRFDTPFEEVLTGNVKKIARRTTDGTVFDKEGGDDR